MISQKEHDEATAEIYRLYEQNQRVVKERDALLVYAKRVQSLFKPGRVLGKLLSDLQEVADGPQLED